MKLLRDFSRRCMASVRAASRRRGRAQSTLSVTVPAPLVTPASSADAVALQPPSPQANRREPASFLKAARHRRLGFKL